MKCIMISSTDGLQVPAHARKASVKARSVIFEKGTRSVSSLKGKRSWNGHYCCVPDCKNSSSNKKVQDDSGHVSYHAFPNVQSVKGKHWIKRIRCDQGNNFVVNSTTKICSEHFSPVGSLPSREAPGISDSVNNNNTSSSSSFISVSVLSLSVVIVLHYIFR